MVEVPLTEDEHQTLDLLAEVWNRLNRIVTGPRREADLDELVQPIHILQRAVLAQASARVYPDRYRLLGQAWPGEGPSDG